MCQASVLAIWASAAKRASLHQTRLITARAVKLPKIAVCITASETALTMPLRARLPCHIPLLHTCCLHSFWAEGFPSLLTIRAPSDGFKTKPHRAAMPVGRGKFCHANRLQSYLCPELSIPLQIPVLIDNGSWIFTYCDSHLTNDLTRSTLAPTYLSQLQGWNNPGSHSQTCVSECSFSKRTRKHLDLAIFTLHWKSCPFVLASLQELKQNEIQPSPSSTKVRFSSQRSPALHEYSQSYLIMQV